MSLRTQLQGTGVAIVTPFKSTMEVDFDALGKLIDFIIENGVEYIVSLGTTGETPTRSLGTCPHVPKCCKTKSAVNC